ncbi:MAG: RDD family protein [Patescibacteria group bacterium]|nr:RDD family protein [Patescibacteria group bacterium]
MNNRGMVAAPEQLDTRIRIVTPENSTFEYRLAGPFRRLPAYLIDLGLRVMIALLGWLGLMLLFGFVQAPEVGAGLGLMLWFLLAWTYGGLFEALWNGQTPGKRALGIRVLTVDGQAIGGMQAVLRNVLRAFDGQPAVFNLGGPLQYMGPFTYLLGFLAASANSRFQRLGDLACGTMVVVEEQPWLRDLVHPNEPEAASLAAKLPLGFEVPRSMGQALAGYVQRRRMFTWQRRMEMARHLAEPLRRRFSLPADTNPDLLLCALYQRTFFTEGAP